MKTIKTAFFDAKPYGRETFDAVQPGSGVELNYFAGHLSADTVHVAAGAICIFINDAMTREVADTLHCPLTPENVRMINAESLVQTTLDNIRAFFERGELANEICYRCGEATC